MFTTQFKVTIATVAAVGVLGLLGANQLSLQKQVTTLQNQKPEVMKVVVSPTPTSTPSATPTVPLKRVLPPTVKPTL